jgi:hypothetical protein
MSRVIISRGDDFYKSGATKRNLPEVANLREDDQRPSKVSISLSCAGVNGPNSNARAFSSAYSIHATVIPACCRRESSRA